MEELLESRAVARQVAVQVVLVQQVLNKKVHTTLQVENIKVLLVQQET